MQSDRAHLQQEINLLEQSMKRSKRRQHPNQTEKVDGFG
jgi:hypothetical protein